MPETRTHRAVPISPWNMPSSYAREPRFVREAPPEAILAAEEADRRLNALDRAGYRITTFERHQLKRADSRRAGRQPVAPCGLATDFLYEAALWTATATLVLGIVLWVVP